MSRADLRRDLKSRLRDAPRPDLSSVIDALSAALPHSGAQIATYLSAPDEFPTDALNAWLIAAGYRLSAPRVIGSLPPEMVFHRFGKGQPTERNQYGIAEPSRDAPLADTFECMLIPLLGVDRRGHRLGYGLGFYDRYLQRYQELKQTRPLLIGLAHRVQLLDSLVPEPWDVPLDYVLTDVELIRCQ